MYKCSTQKTLIARKRRQTVKERRPETNKIQQQLRRHKIIKLKCTREYKNLIFMEGNKEAGIISSECAIVLMINKMCVCAFVYVVVAVIHNMANPF